MTTKRVLIIDDEAGVREVVQACLETMTKWEMLTAASVDEALIKTEGEQPDVILLDVFMPGMSGFAFLQRQQANPAIRSIPVILLTVKVELTEAQQFLYLGARAAIAKPFNPLDLASQIATSLGWSLEN